MLVIDVLVAGVHESMTQMILIFLNTLRLYPSKDSDASFQDTQRSKACKVDEMILLVEETKIHY